MKKLGIALLICTVLLGCSAQYPSTEPVIQYLNDHSVVYDNPSSMQTMGVLESGTGVEVIQVVDGYVKIKTESREGYVREQDLKVTYEETYAGKAESIVAKMSDETLVGQLFLVRCKEEKAIEDLAHYQMGGYLLFAEDTFDESIDSLRLKIASYQQSASIPLLIAVDEEGGSVNRVSIYPQYGVEPFPSIQQLYAQGGYDALVQNAIQKSSFLKSLGFNVNLAPVADVSTSLEDYIHDRTLGRGGEETAKYISKVVSAMHEQGMGNALKHFPGYGNNANTHMIFSIDERSKESFEQQDFLPFQAGIRANADSVLVNHNIVTAFDPSYPASLSPAVHALLREQLQFPGVIISDDLFMDAIALEYGVKEAAVQAVLAGNDLVISTEYEIQIPAVLEALQSGSLNRTQLEDSAKRILIWKQRLGLLE
ncbi:MAG: glycoside hydrolase family 3 N-terminal domain-containing protein [Erysipelotrichaceae bacterium]